MKTHLLNMNFNLLRTQLKEENFVTITIRYPLTPTYTKTLSSIIN